MQRVIHWFRRDLRLHDNTALHAALRAAPEVVPVYILSQWRGRHAWTGAPRQEFLCGSLAVLARNLERIGGRLVIRQGSADEELARLLKETGAEAIYWNRDPDPFGRKMEERVSAMAAERGVAVHGLKDIAIHERDEVLTGKGEPFRVFTPYARAWRKLPKPDVHGAPRGMRTPEGIASLELPTLGTWGLRCGAEIIEPGEDAARRRLAAYVKAPILQYKDLRDVPAAAATSRLSQDLRYGLLSAREVYTQAAARGAGEGAETYINELIWREFYMQVLWHWPQVLDADFNPGYRKVGWFEPGSDFKAWKQGQTGFPDCRCRDAPTQRDRFHAQPPADDRGNVPDQRPAPALEPRRKLLHATPGRWRDRQQQRRLAMERRHRRGRRPLFPHPESLDAECAV
jgi:deoxyribodipyrimidine photo-lyase